MNEMQVGRMKRDPGNSTLCGFVMAVLPVADDRMAERCKLHSDLILQSCQQRDAQQRSCAERAFDGVVEFSAGRFAVPLRAQLLIHTFSSKIVDKRPRFRGEMPANHGRILSDGSMSEKLPNQCVSIACGLGKEENSGRETIDAMDYQSSLSAGLQVLRQKR